MKQNKIKKKKKKGQQSLKNEGKMNQDHNYVEIRW